MKPRVGILRDRFANDSEIQNYEPLAGEYDLEVIATYNASYSGSLPCKRLFSPADLPGPLRSFGLGITNLITGSHTYLPRATNALSEYDIIHTAETYHGFSGQAVKAKQNNDAQLVCTVWENIPYLLENRHYSDNWSMFLRHRTSGARKRKVRDATDVFLAVTERAAYALEREGINSDRIEVIPIGVDTEKFAPGRLTDSDRKKTDFGMLPDGEGLNIVFVGRLTWEKGLYELITAWEHVQSVVEETARLTLIGEGDEGNRLKQYADCINSTEVNVAGAVPYKEVPFVFDASDIAVLPSLMTRRWQEQYGRVIPEAQATGTPVVASCLGGIPNAAGDPGILVQPGDPKDLANALIKLIKDTELRESIGGQSRNHIEENRTLQHTAEAIRAAYKSVIKW